MLRTWRKDKKGNASLGSDVFGVDKRHGARFLLEIPMSQQVPTCQPSTARLPTRFTTCFLLEVQRPPCSTLVPLSCLFFKAVLERILPTDRHVPYGQLSLRCNPFHDILQRSGSYGMLWICCLICKISQTNPNKSKQICKLLTAVSNGC